MTHSIRNTAVVLASCLTMLFATAVFTGCERKEEILEIETPNGEVDVERSLDTGEVDVEVNEH